MPIDYMSRDYGYGTREDGTNKGQGYFGELKRPDGKFSTELSLEIDGKTIPLLVPTLDQDEVNHLLSGNRPTDQIIQKAVQHAKMRINSNNDPFAMSGEQIYQPQTPRYLGIQDYLRR